MKIISTALMALGILLLSGCAAPTPSPTATPAPTETPVPDPERGREIYETGGGVIERESGVSCRRCHSLDGSVGERPSRGPSWQGISERAGDRVPGLSAVEYLRQSILDPSAYVVEGFDDTMMKNFRFFLSEEDIDDLVAFLLTQ